MTPCQSVVASTGAKCRALAMTQRGALFLCTTHANVYDEYNRIAGANEAIIRITTGKTYSDQSITIEVTP